MRKDMFIDSYEQLDIVKGCDNFLKKIKELKPYMVKFEKNGVIKKALLT